MSEAPATTALSGVEGTVEGRETRPGVFDRVLGLPTRLPGPAAAWWLALLAFLVLVPSAVIWITGSQPVGDVQPRVWLPAVTTAFAVAFLNIVDGIARGAFSDFSRGLGQDADKDELLRQLISLPDRLTLGFVLIVEVVVTAGYFSDPLEVAYLSSRPPLELALIVVSSWLSIGLVGVLVLHSVLQLRMIERLHRLAAHIDVLDPGPAHAFARVTSATGIGFVLLGVLVLGDPTAGRSTPFYAIQAVLITLFAVGTFAIPLWGMHDRLVAEKSALMAAANDRIKATVARVHDTVDRDQLDRSAALQASLQSLIAERDLVSHLSTWPWSISTFRAFASAVGLPVAIWIVTRLLQRVV